MEVSLVALLNFSLTEGRWSGHLNSWLLKFLLCINIHCWNVMKLTRKAIMLANHKLLCERKVEFLLGNSEDEDL